MKKKILVNERIQNKFKQGCDKGNKERGCFQFIKQQEKKIKVKIHILWEDMKKGVTQGKKNIYIYDKSQI